MSHLDQIPITNVEKLADLKDLVLVMQNASTLGYIDKFISISMGPLTVREMLKASGCDFQLLPNSNEETVVQLGMIGLGSQLNIFDTRNAVIRDIYNDTLGIDFYELMKIHPIKVVDMSGGGILYDNDISGYTIKFVTLPQPTLYIMKDCNRIFAEWVSRTYPTIGSSEHIMQRVYSSPNIPNKSKMQIIEDVINTDPYIHLLRSKRVAVLGLGVGQDIAVLLSQLGFCNLVVAELPEEIVSVANASRRRGGFNSIGLLKKEAARAEIMNASIFTDIKYIGGVNEQSLRSLDSSDIIVLALDSGEAQALAHEYAFKNKKPLILATDINLGGELQIWRYDLGIELLGGNLTLDELRKGGTAIIKMLGGRFMNGMPYILSHVHPNTLGAFMSNGMLGAWGYFPQNGAAVNISAAHAAVGAYLLVTDELFQNKIFYDPIMPLRQSNRIKIVIDNLTLLRRLKAILLKRVEV